MRYVIGLLLGIGLIVLTFVLIFRAFSGGDDQPQKELVQMTDYATTNTIVRYTIDGRVSQNDVHNRVRITVSKDQVLFEQIQGYEGKLVQTKTYPSNPQAYGTFLRSIDLAGFTQGDANVNEDERGFCPLGRRFIYEIVNGGDQIQRLWSTSCNTTDGSYKGGKAATVRTLFTRQVPDYNQLTSGIRNF